MYLIKLIKNWFYKFFKFKTENKIIRKKYDLTKFTKLHYDYIMNKYNNIMTYNKLHPKNKVTTDVVVNLVNHRFKMNKSRTTISKIWQGKIDRNSLPESTELKK